MLDLPDDAIQCSDFESMAGLIGRNSPRRAGQEPNTEPFFEFSNCMAQRRLRQAELCRGGSEAALPSYRDEGNQLIQTATLH
jgi:hypothetical protein